MAIQKLYVIKPFKYQHRMLTAGDPVEMSGPDARLYEHLGKVSEKKPRVPRAVVPAATTDVSEPSEAPKPKRKRTRRKK